ncbi:MAG TPA: hypothetical protein QGF95_10615 [Candidatus Latescibacteria bacterium]|jgi:hypothetical protein|nr:hypothetical protein [Candidatus Latescibacterota bacterium]HJP30996.1 hypothetical protein [Candidatus Latescibacterota bacterium]
MALTLKDVLELTSRPPTPTLSRDEALDALSRAKRQTRRRADLFREIHAGQVSEGQVESVLLRRVFHGFNSMDPAGRDALLQLLLHLDNCAPDLLSMSWGTDAYGPSSGNTLIDGVLGLARCHADWVRPVTDWSPLNRHERQRFTELSRHLLARYEVPGFFDSVWFLGDHDEASRQQDWFAHVGTGNNLRTAAGLPLPLTKRMAHAVLQAPETSTITEALRYGQVVGWTGSPGLARAVNASRLGRSFAEEVFWSTVIPFLARNESKIPSDWVRSIIDYLHHQRFEHQDVVVADGSLGSGPPAEPNLSMKSRSLPKLMRQVDRWRKAWSVDFEPAKDPEDHGSRRLEYLYLETEDERTGKLLVWTIQELSTARSLANEGQAMSHCLSSKAVSLSTTSVWSVQVRDGRRSHRVMTVAIDINNRYVTQARGRFNANPDRHVDGPQLNPEHGGGDRLKGRLSPREQELLSQSHRILRLWLDREKIAYSKLDL